MSGGIRRQGMSASEYARVQRERDKDVRAWLQRSRAQRRGVQGHPTVWLTAPDGHRAPIDAEIAPLVDAMWRHGMFTRSSCQEPGERPGYATVGLDYVQDVQRLLAIVEDVDMLNEWEIVGWVNGSPDLVHDVYIPHGQIPAVVEALDGAEPDDSGGWFADE